MASFRLFDRKAKADPAVADPAPQPEVVTGKGPHKKGHPTPTRREAEAARKQRLNPTLTRKEAKRRNAEINRERRMAAMAERDNVPEKRLMRDVVDSRWNLGEFMLPALVLMLALTFLQDVWRGMVVVSMIMMYSYIALVLLDLFLIWHKYKKLLNERLPGVSTKGKGIRMYGFNRAIQMRRLRMPAPTIKRGQKI